MTTARTTTSLAALALAAAAHAQDRPHALARAEFGWNSTITAGRWTPARVWLDGSVGPVAGLLTIEYEQDRTQKAQVLVPASTTPGKLTPIDLAVCIPRDVGSVLVTFEAPGLRAETLEFTPPPTAGLTSTPRRGEQRLGQLFAGTRGLIAHAGVGSIDRALPKPAEVDRSPAINGRPVEGFAAAADDTLAELKWLQLAAADIADEDFPTIPQAYEGLEALILDAPRAARLSPRQRDAIRRWVDGGGRLFLLATDDSSAWRSWLPDGPAGEVLEALPPSRLPVPDSVAAGLPASAVTINPPAPAPEDPGTAENPWAGRGTEGLRTLTGPATPLPLRADIQAHPFAVTPAGRAAGWTAGWALPGDPARGLYASGPAGMGIITILGVDPETLPAALDRDATRRLWRHVLARPLHRYFTDPFRTGAPRETEVTAALNTIVGVPPLKDTVFHTILASLAALALLMGPVDWLLLKRYRARQHSWLVALGWIAAASLGAYIIPPLLRSGPPQINRLTVTDILQAQNSTTARARAWQSGLTGIFASGPLSISFDDDPSSPAAGSWWHGVAADQSDDFRSFARSPDERNGLRTIAPIATPQVSSRDAERQNVPTIPQPPGFRDLSLRMPSWAYRTLADASTPQPAPRAKVTPADDGRYTVALAGLPDHTPIGRLSLYDARGRVDAQRVTATDDQGRPISPDAALPERTSPASTFDGFGRWTPQRLPDHDFHWTATIPGPAHRDDAINARLASGSWVLVEIVCAAPLPSARFLPQAALDRDAYVVSGLSTLRILVPLAGDARKEPAP